MKRTKFTAILLAGAVTLAMTGRARAGHGSDGAQIASGILGIIGGAIEAGNHAHGGGWGSHDSGHGGGWGSHNSGHGGGWGSHNSGHGGSGSHNSGHSGWGQGHQQHSRQHSNSYYYPQHSGYSQGYTQRPTQRPTQANVRPTPNKQVEKKKEIVRIDPEKNKGLSLTGKKVSAAEITDWKNQTAQKNHQIINRLASRLPNDKALADQINQLSGYTPQEKMQIYQAIKQGDQATLQFVLKPADKATNLAKQLGRHATAFGALVYARDKANGGSLTAGGLKQLHAALGPYYPPAAMAQAEDLLLQLGANSQLMSLLNTANPGSNATSGGNVQMVWIPGLTPGTVVALGNGAVLIGTAAQMDSICYGTGSLAQAMGMPVPDGSPLPESASKMITEGVVLLNHGDDEANYHVNGKSYSMGPNYSQTLQVGRSWSVTFDRGNSQETARHTLREGTYKFVSTENGWTLYKHVSRVTVDNSQNPFDFHYVVNNQRHSVAAGASKDHTDKYPLIVRFDSGDGSIRQKKIYKGTHVIAMADDGSLDLYAADNIASPVPPEQMIAEAAHNMRLSLFGGVGSTGATLFGGNRTAGGTGTDLFGNSGSGASTSLFENIQGGADAAGAGPGAIFFSAPATPSTTDPPPAPAPPTT